MEFEPKTREEAEKESAFPVWEAGKYDFEVAKAEEQISKSAKDRNETKPNMIKLTLNVYSEDRVQMIFDYLMPAFPIKLIDACEAMGLITEYETGSLKDYQFEGKTGKLRLGVKGESTNKNTGEKYPPKNEVHSYIVGDTSEKASAPDVYESEDPRDYDEVAF